LVLSSLGFGEIDKNFKITPLEIQEGLKIELFVAFRLLKVGLQLNYDY
jgi:hypothetical protein